MRTLLCHCGNRLVSKVSNLQCPRCFKQSLPTVKPGKKLPLPGLWEKAERIFNNQK